MTLAEPITTLCNSAGALGHSNGNDSKEPRLVPLHGYAEIIEVVVGARHVVVRSDGLYSWGVGEEGQLGHGDRHHRYKPTRLEFFDDKKVTKIAAGVWRTWTCLRGLAFGGRRRCLGAVPRTAGL